jgi:hypothetical protein
MGKRTTQYNLAKLVSILEKTLPGLLDRLPSIELFTFSEDMDGLLRLHIGTVCSVVPVCATLTGKTRPKMLYESGKVFKSYYDPGKEDEWYKVTLTEPFRYVKTGGEEWKEKLKAMISFLFLQAGHVKQFIDLNGGEGVLMLIAALKTLPDSTSERKDSVELEKCPKDTVAEDHILGDEISAASTLENDSSTDKTSAGGDLTDDTSAPSSPVTDISAKKTPVKKYSVAKTPTKDTRAKKASIVKVAEKKNSAKKASVKNASSNKSADDEQPQEKLDATPNEDQAQASSANEFFVSQSKNKEKRTHDDLLQGESDERNFTLATLHVISNADFVIIASALKIQKV